MKAGHLPAPPSPVGVIPGGAIGICDLVLRAMCAATLMFIMLLTLIDVFMRYWLHAPITGSAELVMFAMAILIFSALPLVTLREQHISVSILRGRFSGVWAWLQHAVILGVSLLCCLAMAWQLIRDGLQLASEHQATMILELPLGALSSLMGVLSGVSALALVYLLALHVTRDHEPRSAA